MNTRLARKIFILICAVSVISFTGILSACAPAAAPAPSTSATPAAPKAPEAITLKFTSPSPAGSWWDKEFITPLVESFEKRSCGRVKIKYFAGGQLAVENKSYEAAESGLADIAYFVPDHTPGRFPLTSIVELPATYPNCVISGAIMREFFSTVLAKEYTGTKGLVQFLTIAHQIQTTPSKPVKTLDDLKGLKIRSLGGQTVPLLTALGAVPVPVAPAETYTALERGTVDGALFAVMAGDLFKFQDLKLNVTDIKLSTQPWMAAINLKTWNSLPPDLQKEYEAIGYEFSCRAEELYHLADMIATDKYLKAGCKIYDLSPSEEARWQTAVKPVLKEYLDGLKGTVVPAYDAWKQFLSISKKYSLKVPYDF